MKYRFISWGLGVQSTTLAAMSALGEIDRVDAAIHSDTGNERRQSYEILEYYREWLENHDIRVEVTTSPLQLQKDNQGLGSLRGAWL